VTKQNIAKIAILASLAMTSCLGPYKSRDLPNSPGEETFRLIQPGTTPDEIAKLLGRPLMLAGDSFMSSTIYQYKEGIFCIDYDRCGANLELLDHFKMCSTSFTPASSESPLKAWQTRFAPPTP
jgi:hypothetical protein